MYKIFLLLLIFLGLDSLYGDSLTFKTYSKESFIITPTSLMSEKLDGVRGIWDGKTLLSKNNYPINPPKEWLKTFLPLV